MKKTHTAPAIAALALAAFTSTLSTSRDAAAQEAVYVAPAPPPPVWGPPPPTGLGLIVTGSIFLGIGAVNLLTAPICKTGAFDANTSDICLGASLGIGATFAVIGIPMLIVGANRRHDYLEWKRNNAAAALLDVRLGKAPGGGVATWQTSF